MSFSSRMQRTAGRLLSKYDERQESNRIILLRQGSRVWDESLREYVTGSATQIPLTGVVTEYTISEKDSTAIQEGDIKLTVTREHSIAKGDKIQVDDVVYGVQEVDPKAYTGIDKNICYVAKLRR